MLKRSFAVLVFCFIQVRLSAGIIYSNIGFGFPADSPGIYGTAATWGTTFTTMSGGTLATVSIDLSSRTSPVTAALYTSLSGRPGTLLESWSAAVPIGNGFPLPPLTTLISVVQPFLNSGTQYWFVLNGVNNCFCNVNNWSENDQSVGGGIWSGASLNSLFQSFAGSPAPGIQLTSAVPEPTTGMLTAASLLFLAQLRRP
jgi:hypothetical protein